MPVVDGEFWTLDDIARYLGVERDTVTSYRSRGQMPDADRVYGRTPLWRPKTITDWAEQRRQPRRRPTDTAT